MNAISPLRQSPLAPRTTMGVGGKARQLAVLETDLELIEAIRWARDKGHDVHILGGGSNIVVADHGVSDLVLAVQTRGISFQDEGVHVKVTAKAGEPWDAFVAQCVDRNLSGIECLSGIPGTVGATPIQNVGAYGQEVSESITSVEVYDRQVGMRATLDREVCAFAYRDSAFKRDPAQRYVVLAATFRLHPHRAPSLRYPQLRAAVGNDESPSAKRVREIVLELRRAKSMVYAENDPNSRGCGSFFTNPIVSEDIAALAAARATEGDSLPQWTLPHGKVKLPAAWLIERAGFAKGTRRGRVALSQHHCLAIVNHGGASAAEVVSLATEIQATVLQKFGVLIQPEPNFWGYTTLRNGLPVIGT